MEPKQSESAAELPAAIVDVWVTRWNVDPLTRGVYSTLAVGGTPDDRRTLATAVNQRVALAGEYTSADYPATMHGAFHSGEHAAQQLKVAAGDHVIVVGAGIAGLAAARDLTRRGVNVTVLEATSLSGGRAKVEYRPSGVTFHPGAAWIHGTIGNPIAELAQASSVSYSPWPCDLSTTAHVQQGTGLLCNERVSEIETLQDQILLNLRAMAADRLAAGAQDVTIRGPLADELLTIEDRAKRAAVAVLLQQHFESLMAGFLDDLSFHYGDEPFEYPGGDAYLKSPITPMLETLLGDQIVRHNETVTQVSYDHKGVRVTTGTEVLLADGCIIATAVTPLQFGAITFEPALPGEYVRALSLIRMGHKAKVFVQFTTRWWGELERIRVAPSAPNVTDPSNTSTIGTWVDASAVAGVPLLCGFIGGTEAIRLQGMGDDELQVYVVDALSSVRWVVSDTAFEAR
jgi:polyamine oxidase